MPSKIEEFESILSSEEKDENDIQEFMELNSEFIITDNLMNHDINENVVISKFPLGDMVTDFMYMTKSSARWRIVFIELEPATTKLFLNNNKRVHITAELNKGIAQIQSWKEYLRDNKQAVLKVLEPMLRPCENNPVEIRYKLIAGRDGDLQDNEKGKQRLFTLAEDGIDFHTYDSCLRWSIRPDDQIRTKEKPNIITESSGIFTIKHLHSSPASLFAYLSKYELMMSKNHRESLIDKGYEIEAWEEGRRLIVNGKYASIKSIQ